MSEEEYDFGNEFQAVFIPKQKPPPESIASGGMGATLSTYPPLGQITQLKHGSIKFIALLEVDEKQASDPWELALWHNSEGGEWTETLLPSLRDGPTPSFLQSPKKQKTLLYFSSPLAVSASLSFTVKFRSASEEQWRWVKDELSIGDGTIIVNPEKTSTQGATDFSQLVKDVNQDLKITPAASQCPGTELWTIEAPVDAAIGETSSYADLRIGVPWGGFLG